MTSRKHPSIHHDNAIYASRHVRHDAFGRPGQSRDAWQVLAQARTCEGLHDTRPDRVDNGDGRR